MRGTRLLRPHLLAIGLTLVSLSARADKVLATIPVGRAPAGVAINSGTNTVYVANQFDNSVSVIDGATNTVTATVPVGVSPVVLAVNESTDKIYAANQYDNTVSVIDGATNTVTATILVGASPVAAVVNPLSNKIYILSSQDNTVTVIDGANNSTATVSVGAFPSGIAVNTITNKIYVSNQNGDSVTVIDGLTNMTTTVPVGGAATALAVNPTTDKIYVSTCCDTVTVIDGVTNSTTPITVQEYPGPIAVNSVTNKIYVASMSLPNVTVIDGGTNQTFTISTGVDSGSGQLSINSVTNKIYVTLENNTLGNNVLGVIDGATNTTMTLEVGLSPAGVGINATTNRVYLSGYGDNTVSVVAPTVSQFVSVMPCRLVDTRNTGGPIRGGTFRNFTIAQLGSCNIPATADYFSLNVTVVPIEPLGYLTIWPAGADQPVVSSLNSHDGRVKAVAAIVLTGYQGAVSVYASNTTNVILDIDGYFAPVSSTTLAFHPLPPCRVADTRNSNYPQGLGPPYLHAGTPRDFPILGATSCNIPGNAAAYSLNFTAVPHGPLGYLTVWPTGQTQPLVSTLNAPSGAVTSNAAIVAAGAEGDISTLAYNDTDLIIDIDGYFAPPAPGGLSLYPTAPCRVLDTRNVGNRQPFSGELTPPVNVPNSVCGIPASAQGYVFNATVVPSPTLNYLTLWPDPEPQPGVSTLNAGDGWVTSNMAIVPNVNGKIDAFAQGTTQLILDISSYFAP